MDVNLTGRERTLKQTGYRKCFNWQVATIVLVENNCHHCFSGYLPLLVRVEWWVTWSLLEQVEAGRDKDRLRGCVPMSIWSLVSWKEIFGRFRTYIFIVYSQGDEADGKQMSRGCRWDDAWASWTVSDTSGVNDSSSVNAREWSWMNE